MSQNNLIKHHLESGKSISPLEALNLYGCLRLGARIHDLKHGENMPIKSELVNENGKYFARYSLINQA